MNNRCIVNVAFGGNHGKGQERLFGSLDSKDTSFLPFRAVPTGCPPHSEVPYAFKPYAVKCAMDHGSKHVLWMDASCWATGSMQPYWDILDNHGYMFIRGGYVNRQWCSVAAAEAMNATGAELDADHLAAIFMGFNFERAEAREFLAEWKRYADLRVPFAGTADPLLVPAMWSNQKGWCGPNPPILGHRHDQTVASILVKRMGLKTMTCADARFSYKAPDKTEKDYRALGCHVIAAGM